MKWLSLAVRRLCPPGYFRCIQSLRSLAKKESFPFNQRTDGYNDTNSKGSYKKNLPNAGLRRMDDTRRKDPWQKKKISNRDLGNVADNASKNSFRPGEESTIASKYSGAQKNRSIGRKSTNSVHKSSPKSYIKWSDQKSGGLRRLKKPRDEAKGSEREPTVISSSTVGIRESRGPGNDLNHNRGAFMKNSNNTYSRSTPSYQKEVPKPQRKDLRTDTYNNLRFEEKEKGVKHGPDFRNKRGIFRAFDDGNFQKRYNEHSGIPIRKIQKDRHRFERDKESDFGGRRVMKTAPYRSEGNFEGFDLFPLNSQKSSPFRPSKPIPGPVRNVEHFTDFEAMPTSERREEIKSLFPAVAGNTRKSRRSDATGTCQSSSPNYTLSGSSAEFKEFDRVSGLKQACFQPKSKRSSETGEVFESVPSRFRLNQSSKFPLMTLEKKATWAELGLGSSMVQALTSMNIHKPNPMQCEVIPEIFVDQSVFLCAAETGSGKTLAYLVPIMEKLKREEALKEQSRQHQRPRAVILVPSHELVDQVFRIAKQLSHHLKLRCIKISSSDDPKVVKRECSSMIDLLVSTPAALLNAEQDGLLQLESVSHLSIDEADTLLSDDFGQDIRTLLSKFRPRLDTAVLASATIPVSLTMLLKTLFPAIKSLASPKLHSASERVDIEFYDMMLPGNVKLSMI